MSAVKKIKQDDIVSFATLTEFDYKQLRSFEDMLVSSIQAAEETLATAKNRHAIFSRMLTRLEEQNGIKVSA